MGFEAICTIAILVVTICYLCVIFHIRNLDAKCQRHRDECTRFVLDHHWQLVDELEEHCKRKFNALAVSIANEVEQAVRIELDRRGVWGKGKEGPDRPRDV